MEGEGDRREDEDRSEESLGSLEKYRAEVIAKYPDSGDYEKGEAQPASGRVSERDYGASGTKLEGDSAETEQGPKRGRPSSEVETKSDVSSTAPGDVADNHEAKPHRHSESNTETESRNDLEQLRLDFKEKYPFMEGDDREKTQRESQSEAESTAGSNSRSNEVGAIEEKRGFVDPADDKNMLADNLHSQGLNRETREADSTPPQFGPDSRTEQRPGVGESNPDNQTDIRDAGFNGAREEHPSLDNQLRRKRPEIISCFQ